MISSKETPMARLSRRDFLRQGLVFGAGTAALSAGYAAVPDVFARSVLEAKSAGVDTGGILVMIQLAGGNDGLNTVIPLNDPKYIDFRPQLGPQMVNQALRITPDRGLNPNLKGIKALWDQGKVAIAQNVHYPNPSGSHFESTRIWESGDPERRRIDGWLGTVLATQYDTQGHPLTGCACGDYEVPGALRHFRANLTVIDNPENVGFNAGPQLEPEMAKLFDNTPGIYGALFDMSMRTALNTFSTLRNSSRIYRPMADYGNDAPDLVFTSKNDLARSLQLAAELITTGTGVKIIHMTLGGFDTHSDERDRQGELLAYLDEGLTSFFQDLRGHGVNNVTVATWSEFGRRVEENGGRGTDHGTASPMLLIGDQVDGGLYGPPPNLNRLDDDDNLIYNIDFRSVYRTIIETHLGGDPSVLGGNFESIRGMKVAGPATSASPSSSQSPSPSPSPSESPSPTPSPEPSPTPTPSMSPSPAGASR